MHSVQTGNLQGALTQSQQLDDGSLQDRNLWEGIWPGTAYAVLFWFHGISCKMRHAIVAVISRCKRQQRLHQETEPIRALQQQS